jgi:hypothetical protein
VSGVRLKGARIQELRSSLLQRDVDVLGRVAQLKLVTGAQIEALHFAGAEHANLIAAGRACRRVLKRLVRDRLLARLERRVGGVRGGSSGFIYCLTETGQRVIQVDGPRRRFREPTLAFVQHTLAVARVVVDLHQAERCGDIELITLEAEPACWRRYGSLGGVQIVRPDLYVALGIGDFEHRWFVEVDLGTETTPRRVEKCKQYASYFQAGVEQAAHDIFPKIVWSMPSAAEADRLLAAIANPRTRLNPELFAVATHTDLLTVLAGGAS